MRRSIAFAVIVAMTACGPAAVAQSQLGPPKPRPPGGSPPTPAPPVPKPGPKSPLSPREKSCRDAAKELGVSGASGEAYVRRCMGRK